MFQLEPLCSLINIYKVTVLEYGRGHLKAYESWKSGCDHISQSMAGKVKLESVTHLYSCQELSSETNRMHMLYWVHCNALLL